MTTLARSSSQLGATAILVSALGMAACGAFLGSGATSDAVTPDAAFRRNPPLGKADPPFVPPPVREGRLANGIRIRVVETKHVAGGVDTPEDLERVRLMMMATSRT